MRARLRKRGTKSGKETRRSEVKCGDLAVLLRCVVAGIFFDDFGVVERSEEYEFLTQIAATRAGNGSTKDKRVDGLSNLFINFHKILES